MELNGIGIEYGLIGTIIEFYGHSVRDYPLPLVGKYDKIYCNNLL